MPGKPVNSLDFDKDPRDTRVVVAMSGGVDSSVVAGLLAREGYDVLGVTLQLYDHGAAVHRAGSCCAGQDIDDARRVCETLGIPHYVLDYEKRFQEAVINPFAESYVAGETPIPCVACNQTVKFADLLATARDLGADALATGHYIRSRPNPAPGNPGRRALYRPIDSDRDQSYFLFATTQDQLDFLRFPLGGLPKSETRAIAEAFGLGVAAKPDSQDICFVPDGDYAKVVSAIRPEGVLPGEIVHARTGEVLGEHRGVIHYTVGQRRGLEIGGQPEPLYVTGIDAPGRRVMVGPREMLAVARAGITETNRIGPLPAEPLTAKVRSLARPVPVSLKGELGGGAPATLHFDLPEYGVAPGQAAVIYAGERVVGGGWIETTTGSDGSGDQSATSKAQPSPLR